jgi:hypothetical protein
MKQGDVGLTRQWALPAQPRRENCASSPGVGATLIAREEQIQ